MISARARHLVERKWLWLRHARLIVLSGAAEPILYLLAATLGIGQFVGDLTIDGQQVPYIDFVGPGLVAAAAMTGAVFDTTIDVLWRLRFSRTYDAILSTPMSPQDVAVGEVSAGAMRGTFNATVFLAFLAAMGAVDSWWCLMAIPVSALTALAFAAAGMAFTTYLHSFSAFEWLPTITTTLFLFSTTFFPASVYGPAEGLVALSPLYHAVSLERAAMSGNLQWAAAENVAVLAAIAGTGLVIASRRLSFLLLQ